MEHVSHALTWHYVWLTRICVLLLVFALQTDQCLCVVIAMVKI